MTASARPNKTRPNLTMEEHRWQRGTTPQGSIGAPSGWWDATLG